MAYFFQTNRQRRVGGQWNPVRRPAPWGRGPIPQIVLHTFEWPPHVSMLAAATFLLNRTDPGSYHTLAGGTSERDVLRLAPVTAETWHCVPSNKWASGVSATTYASHWGRLSAAKRRNFVHSMAYASHLLSLELIAIGKAPVPAKAISRDEAMRGVWGFTYHRTMDPSRRTDPANPAAAFPWDEFLTEYQRLMGAHTTTPEDDMPLNDDDKFWLGRKIADEVGNLDRSIQEKLPYLTWAYRNPTADRDAYAELRSTRAAVVEAAGQRDGLLEAIRQISGGEAIDLDAITSAAYNGAHGAVQEALGDLSADVTLTVKPQEA